MINWGWPPLLFCPCSADEKAGPNCVLSLGVPERASVTQAAPSLSTNDWWVWNRPGMAALVVAEAGSWSVFVSLSFRWRAASPSMRLTAACLIMAVVLEGVDLGPGALAAMGQHELEHLVPSLEYLMEAYLFFCTHNRPRHLHLGG